ncbi:MAG: glycosyltransferase [Bacteroidales bacterium]|nr:glycosyltransferase [Bacteroidales bacterium]
MKILQLTHKPPYPPKDGGAIVMLNQIKAFSQGGHKVTALCMVTPKHNLENKEIPEQIRNMANFYFVNVNTNIKFIAALKNLIFSTLPYIAERFISEKFKEQLILLLQQKHFDIIQLEGLYLTPYIPVIRANSQARISLRAHNIEHEIWYQYSKHIKNILKKYYFKILYRRIQKFEMQAVNTYDLLVPISDTDYRWFKNHGNIKPYCICLGGMDIKFTSNGSVAPESSSVFYIGALDWMPNQEGLMWFVEKVWPEVHNQFPDVRFYIAGRNAPPWLVKKLKKPNIIFEGEVEDSAVFMQSKSLMVVPLFSGSGMRVKIIEGMALAKTIVTTSKGIEGIKATHNQDVVIADTSQEFAEAIKTLLNQKELLNTIGKNSRQLVLDHFDNKKIVANMITFYNQHIL